MKFLRLTEKAECFIHQTRWDEPMLKRLKNKRGSGYIDVVVIVLSAILVIALAMFVLKGEMNMPLKFKNHSADEFAQWLQSEKVGICLVEHHPKRAYFKNRLPNGLDILYMYRHINDDTISVHAKQ